MYRIKYRVTTLDPIIISDSTNDKNLITTNQTIKGSSLHGAFASKYIKKHNLTESHNNTLFYDLFISDKVSFLNAVITSKNEYDEISENFVIPNNLQREKNNDAYVLDLFGPKLEDNVTKSIVSYGTIKEGFDEDKVFLEPVETSINFHHIRNRQKGTTEDGGIFNYESIDADQIFQGEIRGEKELLENFVSEFGGSCILNIGRSKNTQYGKVRFELINEITEINEEIKSALFTLSLQSETIILNKNGISEVSKDAMQNYLDNIFGVDATIEKAFIKSSDTERYLSIWKMKTPSERCFAPGSSFKIKIDSGIEKLMEVLENGIGEDTNLGFGQVKLFQIYDDKLFVKKFDRVAHFEKPDREMPTLVKSMITKRIEEKVLNSIKLQAIEDVKTFSQGRNIDSKGKLKISNSLIGRLESFVADLDSIEQFWEKINKIRKTSKDKLESLVFGNIYFIDFLRSNTNTNFDNYLLEIPKLVELINYKPTEKIKLNAFKTYWLTFFSYLRKESKTMGGNNAK